MTGEEIEKGIIVSGPRKVIKVGNSHAITLDAQWLKIQRWLGKAVNELISISNSVIVLVPPDKVEKGKEILRHIEEEREA